jgi:hypothetical protein
MKIELEINDNCFKTIDLLAQLLGTDAISLIKKQIELYAQYVIAQIKSIDF